MTTDISMNCIPQSLNNSNIKLDNSQNENDLVLGCTQTTNPFYRSFGKKFANNKIKTFDGNKLYILDIHTNQAIIHEKRKLENNEVIDSIWFFDDYTIINLYDYDENTDEYRYHLKIWDQNLDNCLQTLIGHTGGIFSVIIHENLLITGSEDMSIRIWDIPTGTCLKTLLGHTQLIDKLTAKDNLLISSSEDETIKVWDINTGACIKTYTCPETYVWSMHLIANTLVCGMENGIIKLFDITLGNKLLTEIITLDARNANYDRTGINSVYATKDIIISADDNGYIKFWDMNTHKLIHDYKKQYTIADIYMSDNILIFISDTHQVIAQPITLFLGESNKINNAMDKYNLASHLVREIMCYFGNK
jgi:WD40 repeat protein